MPRNLKVNLTKAPIKVPKPRIPGLVKPIGGSGESDPAVSARNSQKGTRQRVPINIPGVKT